MKKVLSLIILFISVFSVINTSYANSMSNTEMNSIYKLTQNNDEWKELNTHDKMVEKCRVPQMILKSMSTNELVDSVLKYPLLYDVYAFNNVVDAIENLKNNSDAFRELITRDDASEYLIKRMNRVSDSKLIENRLMIRTIKLLLKEENISKSGYNIMGTLNTYSTTTVYTPNGSAVTVIIAAQDFSSAEKQDINDYFISTYPLATYVSTSTKNYNCHSYAWYSSSTSNQYWMDDPSRYMSDGSYSKVSTPMRASHMYYATGNHSAKIYDVVSNVISKATVISKWGQGPVMIHKANYSPYNTSNLSVWIKN